MSRHSISSSTEAKQILPYTCEQLFDLVFDIERYPEFLPGWIKAKVIGQTDSLVHVRQTLGLPVWSQTFLSTAEPDRPSTLRIRSSDGPFTDLHIEWQFQPSEGEQCEVKLQISVTMKGHLLGRLAAMFQDTAAVDILSRFAKRARLIYGASGRDHL